MQKKILALLAVTTTFLFSTVVLADIYCPPGSAVHCVNGNCTLSAAFANQWSLAVVGKPTGFMLFGGAMVKNAPSHMECILGSSDGNYVNLHSNNYYSPNTKVPGNAWINHYGKMDICQAVGNPKACPFY